MGVFKSRRALLCSALVTMLIGLQSPPTHALALQECKPILQKTKLPQGCSLNDESLMETGETKGSFYRAACSMEQCSTVSGTYGEENAMCCCRAQQVEELDIYCADPKTEERLDPSLKTNETWCSCAPCGDVMIVIRLSMRGPDDDGPIPAAQIFDMETQEIVGLTLYNGILDFEVPFQKQSLQLLIQATGYQRITRSITLSPKHTLVVRNITMSRLIVSNIGPGKSEIFFPLGDWAWLYAQPGSFHKNGTAHDHDVVFKGSYMDSRSNDVLDTLESERFEVDGSHFAILAAVFMEFEDTNGEPLDVNDVRLAVPLEEEDVDMFAAVHDWESGKWTKVSTFSPVQTRRSKRQTNDAILEAPDISVGVFVVLATAISADCWAQIRTFDLNQDPFPGPFVSMVQRRRVAGMDFLYRFGTDTGGAQTTVDMLASNAVCIPLECNDFIEGRITARVEPNTQLTPIPFPDNSFTIDPGGSAFVLNVFTPAEIARAPRPTYILVDNCIQQARESNAVSNPLDHFSFSTDYTPLAPTEQCFIKITIADCFARFSTTTVTSFEPQSGDLISTRSFETMQPILPVVGSGFPEECLDYERSCPSVCSFPHSACLPFRCSSRVEITVTSTIFTTGNTTACELTSVSPILDDSILAFRGNTWQEDLAIDTSVLDPDSFNDPELGLYYDPQPTMALELCQGGGSPSDFIIREGYAGEFGCFTDTS